MLLEDYGLTAICSPPLLSGAPARWTGCASLGRGRQVGNFPQAFSHLTLILAARAISEAQAADD